MRFMLAIAALLLAGCLACSSVQTMSPASDSGFAGTWAQREAVLGTSFVLTLTVDGSKVSGTGTYQEDSKSGSVSAKGEISGDRLKLAITYESGSIAQFDGELSSSASELKGSLHFGPAQSLTAAAIVAFDKKD